MNGKQINELFFTLTGAYLLAYTLIDVIFSHTKIKQDAILFVVSFMFLIVAHMFGKKKIKEVDHNAENS